MRPSGDVVCHERPDGKPGRTPWAREWSDILKYGGLLLPYNGVIYFSMGYASAMAVVLFIAILALTLLIFRTSRYWVFYEGDGSR